MAKTKPLNTTETEIKPSIALKMAYSMNQGLNAITEPEREKNHYDIIFLMLIFIVY